MIFRLIKDCKEGKMACLDAKNESLEHVQNELLKTSDGKNFVKSGQFFGKWPVFPQKWPVLKIKVGRKVGRK